MRKHILGAVAVVCSGAVWAADFEDTARVISSTPIYERVSEPKQECWSETVSTSGGDSGAVPAGERSIGGAVIGGVVGGVLGSQVGQGHGNTAATAAGAIAGTIIGDRIANPSTPQTSQTPQTRQEQRCRQVESSREVIRGYNVTYRYNGQDITTRLPYQPGSTVRVGISVLGEGNASSDVRDYRSGDRKERRGKGRGDSGYND